MPGTFPADLQQQIIEHFQQNPKWQTVAQIQAALNLPRGQKLPRALTHLLFQGVLIAKRRDLGWVYYLVDPEARQEKPAKPKVRKPQRKRCPTCRQPVK